MERDKQIEEMAADLFVCHTEALDGNDDWRTDYDETARKMTEKGYRKQAEGEWIVDVHDWDFTPYDYNYCTCSVCGNREQIRSPYCRECGAKMKGE